MDYVITVKIPDRLLRQVEMAAKSLNVSANDYLKAALHEKIGRWIHNESSQSADFSEADCMLSSAQLPDELLSQTERAAASYGLSVDEFLHQALREKVMRLSDDIVHKEKMDSIVKHLFETRGELYRRLATWPTAESVSQ
jgi:predicted HicB family RNase H-like nuclease